MKLLSVAMLALALLFAPTMLFAREAAPSLAVPPPNISDCPDTPHQGQQDWLAGEPPGRPDLPHTARPTVRRDRSRVVLRHGRGCEVGGVSVAATVSRRPIKSRAAMLQGVPASYRWVEFRCVWSRND
jgi:hypothetical protein